MPRRQSAANARDQELRGYAMALPGAYEDYPWGERVAKVGKKVFAFFGTGQGGVSLSVKLPESSTVALMLPFTAPTGYGLGKSGWVTASFEPNEVPPLDMLREWIEESYRAVAPKKLVATMGIPARSSRRNPARTK
jgi:predicted DNA-binding protein (MmcQ/YjbR family)